MADTSITTLQDTVATLEGQLALDPENTTLQTDLAAAQSELDAAEAAAEVIVKVPCEWLK